MRGEEFQLTAQCFHDSIKNFKPPISKIGSINNTPFQTKLVLKTGAKVMLAYNVNTADGLVNGSRVLRNESGDITKLVIKFENQSHGKLRREAQQNLEQ